MGKALFKRAFVLSSAIRTGKTKQKTKKKCILILEHLEQTIFVCVVSFVEARFVLFMLHTTGMIAVINQTMISFE